MKNNFKSNKGSEKRPRKAGGFNPSKPSTNAEGEKRYNFRDNPKTYGKSDGQLTNFGAKRPASKPHVSKFDSNDKYGSRKVEGDRPARKFDADKPRFGGNDRPERKPFGDRPARNFDGEKPRFDSSKPRFSNNEKPERKPFGDRPARNFDSEKPRFGNTGDRPDRKSFDDRPPRKFEGDRPRFDSEKPRFGESDRPERKTFSTRSPRSFGERHKKDYQDREVKKSFGDKPFGRKPMERPRFDDRGNAESQPVEPRPDKFAHDKSRFSSAPGRKKRPSFEAPRSPRGPKRFDGPYQKNLNSDTGGSARSAKRDHYRSDGAHFDYESRLKETIEEKNGTIRLNRFIANSGICSRRDADELIEAGQITVNGEIITEMGHQVKPTDAIKYGNKLLTREKMVYVLLNKPKDYITTTEDPQERKTVMNLIEGACKERIYPVGRLDRNTTGLILLTNDGELAAKLTHPSYQIEKMYQVELDKPIVEEDYQKILKGITLEDGEIKADSFGIVTPDAMVVGIQIHSGRNHIVRRIFAHLGYEVIKLDRTVFAGLNKKDLPRGNYRFLTEKEVIKLKYLS